MQTCTYQLDDFSWSLKEMCFMTSPDKNNYVFAKEHELGIQINSFDRASY